MCFHPTLIVNAPSTGNIIWYVMVINVQIMHADSKCCKYRQYYLICHGHKRADNEQSVLQCLAFIVVNEWRLCRFYDLSAYNICICDVILLHSHASSHIVGVCEMCRTTRDTWFRIFKLQFYWHSNFEPLCPKENSRAVVPKSAERSHSRDVFQYMYLSVGRLLFL